MFCVPPDDRFFLGNFMPLALKWSGDGPSLYAPVRVHIDDLGGSLTTVETITLLIEILRSPEQAAKR